MNALVCVLARANPFGDACRRARMVAATLVAGVALGGTASQATTAPSHAIARTAGGFAIATAPYDYRWPADHAAHPDYQSEWWYYTGHLMAPGGRRFGFELTFFRVGLAPGDPRPTARQSRWRGNDVYPAHFAITDERGQTFYHVERFAREAIGMGRASATTLDVRADDWSLRGVPVPGRPDRETMTLHAGQDATDGRNALDLVATPEKSPAIHGHDGVSRKASCFSCASHYYSYTRMRTAGTLVYRGTSYRVDGLSWMDHEYGSGELKHDQAGWDWFAIQLDDRRELMLYALRQRDGSVTPESSGSLVSTDGTVHYLPRAAFVIDPTGSWKSPHTGGAYPSGWRVRIPNEHIDLTLAPTVLDQELADTTTGISYWEGAVDVADTATKRALGLGYVELTGYAGAISL